MNVDNQNCASDSENFASQTLWQFTLRELRALVTNYKFWIGFLAVAILLAVTGPFATIDSMQFPKRLVYWTMVALITFLMGYAIFLIVEFIIGKSRIPGWASWILAGLIAGPPIGLFTWYININLFDLNISNDYSVPEFLVYTTAIACMISLLSRLFSPPNINNYASTKTNTPQSVFFSRLPPQLGKDLISLEAQDHYVKVTTKLGNELILMRLSDAEKELGAYKGLRVHRSWWVAINAVASVKRTNGKIELEMKNDDVIPVSRSYARSLGKLDI